MVQSIFSYGLTRPYPYRPWFTWLVLLGSIIAAALFSALNIAANGYEVVSEYVTDVNETENPILPAWYQRRPWSLASRVKVFCQDQIFEIGSQFYTNNTILKYEIEGLTTANQTHLDPKISFTYHNDTLRDCILHELVMRRNPDSGFQQARVNCTTYDARSRTPIVLRIVYTYTASTSDEGYLLRFYEERPTPQIKAASWWGTVLLFVAEDGGCLPFSVATDNFNLGDTVIRAQVYKFYGLSVEISLNTLLDGPASSFIQDPPPKTVNSSLQLDQWTSTYGNDTLRLYKYRYANGSNYTEGRDPSHTDDNGPARPLILFWDSIAKIFYSYILTDLGQSVESNILGDAGHFVNFLNATKNSVGSDALRDFQCSLGNHFIDPVFDDIGDYEFNDTDPTKFYDWYGSVLPAVYPAVINTQYLCQIPRRKPIGTIIVNTIVADFVFLQALWLIFSFVVRFVLERRDPQANYCVGCIKMMESNQPNGDTVPVPSYECQNHESSGRYSLVTTLGDSAIRERQVGSPPQTGTVNDNGFQTVSLLSGGESVHTLPPHAY